jgi:SAM-dependent methyltransferase
MIDVQEFWMNPDASCMPENTKAITRPQSMLGYQNVTNFVCEMMLRYVAPHESILELGSGTGRNLAGLHLVGYSDLYGIEISPATIEVGRKHWDVMNKIPIWCGAIEDAITTLQAMDCIFTVGTLMHLPPSSEWVFEQIAKKARKYIMTIELETSGMDTLPIAPGGQVFGWLRNYSQIFSGFGWDEIEFQTCEALGPLLGHQNIARVFAHG